MIEAVIAGAGIPCTGGFIAYYNDTSLYARDAAKMFSDAIAVVFAADGSLFAAPVDLTKPGVLPTAGEFLPLDRGLLGTRSTGALFATGCYFSVRSGPFQGAYQISHDYLKCSKFPTIRAYRTALLHK